MKKNGSKARLITFLFFVLTVGGCSSGPEAHSGPLYQDFDFAILEQEAQIVADCVEDRTGFVLDVFENGGVGYGSDTVPKAQSEAVSDEIDNCTAELIPQSPETFSVELLERLYGLQVDARNCYVDLGFDLPEPTSKETFIDEFQSGGMFWNVIQDLVVGHRLSESKQIEIFQECPDPFDFFWR
ncbi:hypothetical protein V5R04_07125 [Jonesiaceae bacterium BS-20]|uniref:Lipoprotein n=1 Tax=Jonesiaceae bacterium BS-20 TaxID=3120821 RepID=A0AAU7DZ44_9MICO